MIGRTLFFLQVAAAGVGTICLVDPDVGLCPPDDLPGPPYWTGFSTDSTSCWDPGFSGQQLSISASFYDPFVNEAPIPIDGRVYLWVIGANGSYGYSGIRTTLETDGSVQIGGYEPVAPGYHEWDMQTLSLVFFDPETCFPYFEDVPSQVIGAILLKPTSVEDQSWGRIKALWR